MRVALILIALLALSAGEARADVFLPADPPVLRSAYCSAGAGDVVAAGNGTATLRISVGGGGWHVLSGLGGCPVVAGAADGTLAIAGSGDRTDDAGPSLVVRGAGGAFGAPIALGGETSPDAPSVAAAPGGWVAAAVVTADGLMALVARPDGTSERTVLEPAAKEPTSVFISDVHVGIDASGNVTIVWRRFAERSERLRTARGVAGAAPVVGADLPTGAGPARGLALAVAPGGGTLVAWASGLDIRAIVDGQAPQLVGRATAEAVLLAAAIADDGTALLASMGQRDEIAVAERVAGSWQPARVVGQAGGPASYQRSEDEQKAVLATVAPGGRAAVAWSVVRDDELKVFGVAGQVGGTWAAAARLSSITRRASTPSLAPDATGVPRVLWIEHGLGVRGASLAPARLDTSAPAVTARFPLKVPPTKTGAITVPVRVTCSESCDARVEFVGNNQDDASIDGDDGELGDIVGALEPGRATILHLRPSFGLQMRLISKRSARRVRLRLVVTDRAGNVARRSATLRVRVLEPPVRTFKVALGRRFGMETRAGDRAVARFVNDVIETVARGHVSDRALARRYTRGLKAIVRRFGPDSIYSDEVGEAIYDALWVPLLRTHHDVGILSG